MSWKDTIKKDENLNFAEDESAWMERDAENAFNVDSHKQNEVKHLLIALSIEIDERLRKATDQVHITYKDINEGEVRKKLLPIIKELVENHLEFDMSKFRYSGP